MPLQPLSAVPFLRQQLETGGPPEVEVMDRWSAGAAAGSVVSFDGAPCDDPQQSGAGGTRGGEGAGGGGSAGVLSQAAGGGGIGAGGRLGAHKPQAVLRIGPGLRSEAIAYLSDAMQTVMTGAGLGALGGPGSSAAMAAATLGRAERRLKVVPRPAVGVVGGSVAMAAGGAAAGLVGGDSGAAESVRVKLDVGGGVWGAWAG